MCQEGEAQWLATENKPAGLKAIRPANSIAFVGQSDRRCSLHEVGLRYV